DGGAAEMGRADEGRLDAEIFGERQHREASLGGGAEQAVHVLERGAAVGERTKRALRHQVDRRHFLGDLAEIGFRRADNGGAATLEPAHRLSSRTNTGQGGSSPPRRCTRKRTRMPIFTSLGGMSSTRLISRKPSSQSISATLNGAPSCGCTTVVACTVPAPLLTRHSSRSLPVNGQRTRG